MQFKAYAMFSVLLLWGGIAFSQPHGVEDADGDVFYDAEETPFDGSEEHFEDAQESLEDVPRSAEGELLQEHSVKKEKKPRKQNNKKTPPHKVLEKPLLPKVPHPMPKTSEKRSVGTAPSAQSPVKKPTVGEERIPKIDPAKAAAPGSQAPSSPVTSCAP